MLIKVQEKVLFNYVVHVSLSLKKTSESRRPYSYRDCFGISYKN